MPPKKNLTDFNNTEIAFAAQSDRQLRQSALLFSAMNKPGLVKWGTAVLQFFFKANLPIKGLVKKTLFQQFCGGESIEDCAPTIAALGEYGIDTILDYAVEGSKNEDGFDSTVQEVIKSITYAAKKSEIPFSVFKPTGIAPFELLAKIHAGSTLTEDEQAARTRFGDRVEQICAAAAAQNVKLLIDAEESWIQQEIDTLARKMMQRYNREKPIVYNTYQLYLKNSLARLKRDFERAVENNYYLGAKLVRGAYMEKERKRAKQLGYESPVHPHKHATDEHFDSAVLFCVNNCDRIALMAGSHNAQSNYQLVTMMQKKNINPSDAHFYFGQLFGMSDHISYNLAHSGFNVVKYVPYGPVQKVMPYLFRRAEENTAISGQTGREYTLLRKEQKRRKKAATIPADN